MTDHGVNVSKSSVPNLLKEIDFKKREERNRKRKEIRMSRCFIVSNDFDLLDLRIEFSV